MAPLCPVSIIIPAYNAEETISATLESVWQQTHAPLEVIIVDDGSTDRTAEIVRRQGSRLRYQWQNNGGPAAARNRGITMAATDIIAFLDADDIWPRHALGLLVQHLVERPSVDIVQGHMQDMWPGTQPGDNTLDPRRLGPNIGSAIFRRSVFARVGEFNPQLRRGEDFDYWIRIREHNISRFVIEDVTLLYRRKVVNPIDDKQIYYSNLTHSLKRALDRTRLP